MNTPKTAKNKINKESNKLPLWKMAVERNATGPKEKDMLCTRTGQPSKWPGTERLTNALSFGSGP